MHLEVKMRHILMLAVCEIFFTSKIPLIPDIISFIVSRVVVDVIITLASSAVEEANSDSGVSVTRSERLYYPSL